MNLRSYILESTLGDISKSRDPVFLLVIGGSASGKNYVYGKHFDFPLVDVDEITKRLSGGDFEKARKMVSKAIAEAGKLIDRHLKRGVSVAQVTTGAGVKAVENKFKRAREAGFKTALVLVDTDLQTAIQRNRERDEKGKQGLIPDWKVEKTNKGARDTYEALRKSVDFATVIKN